MAQPTRTERKSKRRKTNRVLNTAIAVVVLLIVVVAFTIFSGGNNEEAKKPEEKSPAKEETAAYNTEENKNNEAADSSEEEMKNADEEADEKEKDKEKDKEKEDKQEKVVKESSEPNVEKEIIDPNWKGIGTSQTGEHVSSFDSNSVDWQEKLDALSYATGIPNSEMTVWFVKGQGPNAAIGTVSPKSNSSEAYRVHLTWVDGEGWKPEKVQKLEQNDKGQW
ncbi:YrrS family protein [Bacillus xiapuensis]|uniref:YrrS family protein n=1 Tax=Bacillus xiapuensis TaxID=2014075 RepID=UPI000C24B897|nr:YrrS family protein [Bacillus xiapuensis]